MNKSEFEEMLKCRFRVIVQENINVGCKSVQITVPAKKSLNFKPVTGEVGVTHRADFGELSIALNVNSRADIKFLQKCKFKYKSLPK
jgi:hypothetical protein